MQNISLIVTSLCISGLIFCSEASAQFASLLGVDSGTQTTYECIRFGDPNLNSVRTTKGGKVKALKIAAAKKKVAARINALKERRFAIKDLLKEAIQHRNILQKNPLSILHPDQLEKAKKKVESLSTKVGEVTVQIETLKELLKAVGKCAKPSDPTINGSLQVLSGLFDNGSQFYVIIGYVWDTTQPGTQDICADVSGQQMPIPMGWGGIVYPELPNRTHLAPVTGPCFIFGFNCVDPYTQGIAIFVSDVGPQAPGSCFRPSDCSLEAALMDAQTYWGGLTVSNVKPITAENPCQ